ncbi:MAG: hypothetical protein JW864_17310 [Spirochaetes bacterium]|nr:hypothetical protein [Spirochaetota bacterium]
MVTKRINKLHRTPGIPVWQTRFYFIIIRNNVQLQAIRKYIEDNQLN